MLIIQQFLTGKPIGSEEFLNYLVEALGITADRGPKGRPRKMESQTIEKIECVVLTFH